MTATSRRPPARPARLRESDCSVDDFAAVVSATTDVADYPHADRVEQGVLVYDSADAASRASSRADGRAEVEGELVRALDRRARASWCSRGRSTTSTSSTA